MLPDRVREGTPEPRPGLLVCAIAASFCWIVRLLEQQ